MFDWRDYLELARLLGAGQPGTSVRVRLSEATVRSAVGRAYYAAFGHARSYAAQNLGFVATGTAADHGRLTAHFQANGMVVIARQLSRLRRQRNQCDYDNLVSTLPTMAQDALRTSAAIIHRL